MRRLGLPVAIVRPRFIGVLLVMLILVGCGGGGAATPEAAFSSLKEALKDKDFKTIWNLLSSDSKKLIDDQAKEIREKAANAEGPARTAAENMTRAIDMKMEELKTVTGEKLFEAAMKMSTATDDKSYWNNVAAMEMVGEPDESKIGEGIVTITAKVGDQESKLEFVKEGAAWKFKCTDDYLGLEKKIEEAKKERKEEGKNGEEKDAGQKKDDGAKSDDKGGDEDKGSKEGD